MSKPLGKTLWFLGSYYLHTFSLSPQLHLFASSAFKKSVCNASWGQYSCLMSLKLRVLLRRKGVPPAEWASIRDGRDPNLVGSLLKKFTRNVQPCTSDWQLLGELESSSVRNIFGAFVGQTSFISSFTWPGGNWAPALIPVRGGNCPRPAHSGSRLNYAAGWMASTGLFHHQAKAVPVPPHACHQHWNPVPSWPFPNCKPYLGLVAGQPPQPEETRDTLGSSTGHHPG